ncbi:hypothetical protein LPTSP2_39550 [Leptospira ellinghausenii]|uniref:SH3b domain-containing protein n=1 Tax=Leptospira ellinghausenii TaxID=1917822 RepID=A0A2P2DJ94_9LEPT|nr:SH3 domain-containing protein [Leptospira ellinghausenii]GBF44651.1 hypothetical protein LPTSP2_39550 [Leptospira ellinghausenii]
MLKKKEIIIIFILIINFWNGTYSKENKKNGYGYIVASGGLNVRELPNLHSKIIYNIEYGEKIYWSKESKLEKPIIISGISGNWVSVKFNKKVGYVFDGYLVPIIPPEEDSNDIEDYLNSNFKIISTRFEPEFLIKDEDNLESNSKNEKKFSKRRIIEYENKLTFFTLDEHRENGMRCLQSTKLSLQELYLISTKFFPFSTMNINDSIVSNLVSGKPITELKIPFESISEKKYTILINKISLNYYLNGKPSNKSLDGNFIYTDYDSPLNSLGIFSKPKPTICFGFVV